MGKLGDHVALITGSDSGIGHATAVEYAREGADIVVNFLEDEDGANHTKRLVEEHGRRAIVVQADHGYEDEVERLFAAGIDAFGRIDVLMNNASVDASGVHVADIPNPGGSDYDCSKSALRMLTRTLSVEVAAHGINVNSLAPGMVLTPFNQPAIDDPELLDEQVQSIPLKRAAQPEEIAKLALFLASSDSDYVTGSTYVMDGGLMRSVGQGA